MLERADHACVSNVLQKLGKVWFPPEKHNFKLLYRGSRDGMGAYQFHLWCDNKGPTLTLVAAQSKNFPMSTFGAVASVPWQYLGLNRGRDGSFIFTVQNPFGDKPGTVFRFHEDCESSDLRSEYYDAVVHQSSSGPVFGRMHSKFGPEIYCNLKIDGGRKDFDESSCFFSGSAGMRDTTGRGSDVLTGNNTFKVHEIEVWEIITK